VLSPLVEILSFRDGGPTSRPGVKCQRTRRKITPRKKGEQELTLVLYERIIAAIKSSFPPAGAELM
jgi:hypothetical protein